MEKNKYLVISLPRTGTSSIALMAKMCGLEPQHNPTITFDFNYKVSSINFYSDTPVFAPSVIKELCENKKIIPKFIFIENDFTTLYDSWVKVNLASEYNYFFSEHFTPNNDPEKLMVEIYNEVFEKTQLNENTYQKLFQNHKEKVFELVKKYDKELLIYNFDDGWGPFCDFIGCEAPKDPIPHLNNFSCSDYINHT